MTAAAFVMCDHGEALDYAATTGHATTGHATTCRDCGARVEMADVEGEAERPSHVALAGPPMRALARAIAEVGMALRVTTEERADNRVREFRAVTPHARLLSSVGSADHDATDREVCGLAEMLLRANPGKVAREKQAQWTDRVLRYCDETSRPADLPGDESRDDADARRHLRRMRALPEATQRVLAVVARGGASQGWPDAVARVVEHVLPAPTVRVHGAARDGARVPEAVRRRVEADGVLRAAVEAWESGG